MIMHRFEHADLTLLARRPAKQPFAQDADDIVFDRLEKSSKIQPSARTADDIPFRVSKATERNTQRLQPGSGTGSNSRSSRTHDTTIVSPHPESSVAQSANEDSHEGLIMLPATHKCTKSGCSRKFATLKSLKYAIMVNSLYTIS
jgi:hypothetical protein